MGYNDPLQRRNQVKTFRKAGELVVENMTTEESTKLYVLGAVVYTLALAGLIMIVKKIIRRK
jgi:hypothetical protein